MSNSQDRFFFVRLLTFGGIAFLLLGLLLSSSAQAELITAVRVNALNGAGNYNYREANETYSNYNFSLTSDAASTKWCTQANGKPYNMEEGAATPIMLCDLGSVQTINGIYIVPYNVNGNQVKTMTVEFYDSPAINATPIYTQVFSNMPSSASTLNLTTPTNARFVKFTMTENRGDNRVGVVNVKFDVVPAGMPISETVNVASHENWPVSNLFDNDTSSRWVTAVSTSAGYFNGSNPDPVFTFTYGVPQTFSGISVNNYDVSGNCVKDFNLTFYDANGTQISVDDPSQYRLTMTHYTNTVRDDFTFPAVENVSKIEMTLTSNFKGTGKGGDRVGLAEVKFTAAIEPETPTTPVVYNAPLSNDNAIVRPNAASFLTPGAERASARALTYLFDGTANSPGGNEWYTIDTKVGDNVIPDYYTVGYTPVIEFTMPAEAAYDSFSIWGYNSEGNQMSDFTLELYDSNGKLVYADEYFIDEHIAKSEYATFSLGQNYVFKKAVLTALDNGYGIYAGGGGDRVGFTEIAFYSEPYYFANTTDIDADSWTIDGTTKKGVLFADNGDKTATFANPVVLNADGVIDVAEGKTLLLTGGISGQHELKKTGDGLLQINSAAGAVDVQSLIVSSGRLDMKTYFEGTLTVGEELEDGSYTKATFSPGNSIGTLTVDGNFTLSPGSTLLMEIGTNEDGTPAADQLIVTGDATFAPGSFIYLDLDENSALNGGDTFTAILQANNSADFGDDFIDNFVRSYYFTGLQYTQLGDGTYAITATLDPNAVPEPSTWALLILGAAGLLYWRKRDA
ncbi:MAG: PEP-CTERM sorting domain-containing protein [Thermoguttaceae bacterium]|nr:PEP-CTERM sorting domain-containing protein [Thermoguttaceae bacterium]